MVFLLSILFPIINGLFFEDDVSMKDIVSKEYLLSVGDEDEKRLDLLNAVYNSASRKFLSGILHKYKGDTLELGCGTGIISRIIAEKIIPNKIIAIDNSEKQIEVAKKKGYIPENLVFHVCDAKDILAEGKLYDIIYTRFLLVHMTQLSSMLELIKNALSSNGIIIIEDVESIYSQYVDDDRSLTNSLLEIDRAQWKELLPREKIVEILHELGFKIMKESSFRPELKTAEERKLLTWGLESVKNSMVSSRLISEKEMNKVIASAKELELDFRRRVFYYRMFQLVAKKI